MDEHAFHIMYKCTIPIYIYIYIYIYTDPPWGLSTLAKEFSAAARIMRANSNELSAMVSGKV